MHACQLQSAFYAKLKATDWKDNNKAKPYATFQEFKQEACLCAIGYDYNFKCVAVKDEVECAWGLVNAARNNNDFISQINWNVLSFNYGLTSMYCRLATD